MPEDFERSGNEDLTHPPSFFPTDLGKDDVVLVEVDFEGVFQSITPTQPQPFVILTEGNRRLDIAIGTFEAHAISRVADGVVPERPYTHDLLKSMIEALGATVHSIVIEDLWNDIYFAKIYLRRGDLELEIDARPSDAIAMAVRFDAPIYVSDKLLSD